MLLKEYKEFLEEISQIRITNTYLAKLLGTTSQNISKRIKTNSVLTTSELTTLEETTGVYSLDETANKKVRAFAAGYLDQKEDFTADYYPDVFGSCGSGVFVLSEYKELINVPKKIIKSYSKEKKYSVINAYGDSMMPFIHDKDLLIVEHYEGEQIRDNRVYVFRYGDNIFVKRLVLNINQLVIKSDNTDYKTITVDLHNKTDDIQIIGKIVGLMRGMV